MGTELPKSYDIAAAFNTMQRTAPLWTRFVCWMLGHAFPVTYVDPDGHACGACVRCKRYVIVALNRDF